MTQRDFDSIAAVVGKQSPQVVSEIADGFRERYWWFNRKRFFTLAEEARND